MRAISTEYNGYYFRSRLEARWSIFFEHLGIDFEYENEGIELSNGLRILPDFWMPQLKVYFEVEPIWPGEGSLKARKAVMLAYESKRFVYESVGSSFSQPKYIGDGDYQGQEIRVYTPNHFPCNDYESDFAVSWYYCSEDKRFCLDCSCESRYICSDKVAESKIIQAYKSARSARFEFGETPA